MTRRRMHYRNIFLGFAQAFFGQAKELDILPDTWKWRVAALALKLDAQHVDNVAGFHNLVHVVTDGYPHLLDALGDQRRGARHHHLRAELLPHLLVQEDADHLTHGCAEARVDLRADAVVGARLLSKHGATIHQHGLSMDGLRDASLRPLLG